MLLYLAMVTVKSCITHTWGKCTISVTINEYEKKKAGLYCSVLSCTLCDLSLVFLLFLVVFVTCFFFCVRLTRLAVWIEWICSAFFRKMPSMSLLETSGMKTILKKRTNTLKEDLNKLQTRKNNINRKKQVFTEHWGDNQRSRRVLGIRWKGQQKRRELH